MSIKSIPGVWTDLNVDMKYRSITNSARFYDGVESYDDFVNDDNQTNDYFTSCRNE